MSVLVTSCNLQSKTKEEILLQQKQLPNTKTLRQKSLETVADKIAFKDTLYVITAVNYGICGNDERFNKEERKLTKEEIKEHQKYIKENPYYLDKNDVDLSFNHYQPVTNFAGKTLITGCSFENDTFKSGKNEQKIEKIKKPLYYLNLQILHKDTVQATVSKFKANEKLQFILTRNDTLWNIY